jgi:hypothetical protein
MKLVARGGLRERRGDRICRLRPFGSRGKVNVSHRTYFGSPADDGTIISDKVNEMWGRGTRQLGSRRYSCIALGQSLRGLGAGAPGGASLLRSHRARGGAWNEAASRSWLTLHLRHSGKKYHKRKGKNSGRGWIPNRNQRPSVVAAKSRITLPVKFGIRPQFEPVLVAPRRVGFPLAAAERT